MIIERHHLRQSRQQIEDAYRRNCDCRCRRTCNGEPEPEYWRLNGFISHHHRTVIAAGDTRRGCCSHARLAKRRLAGRIHTLRDEMVDVSADASVGRRLNVGDYPDTADLARTINQLFDALGERDQKIQGRDRLFRDFARTLPEIVLIHDDKILLANESAAALIGLEACATDRARRCRSGEARLPGVVPQVRSRGGWLAKRFRGASKSSS